MRHPPRPSVPHQSPSVTSLPPTPSTANRPTSLSANAGAFVPGKNITIKNPSGQVINLDALKRARPPVLPIAPVGPPSPASSSKKDVKRPIRIESQEQKERRLAEESAREGKSDERPRSSDSFVKDNEDAARRQMEVRKHRKAEKRKLKKEAKRAEKERKDAEEGAGSTRGSSGQDGDSPEVDRIVKALLNQLTMECFDSISNQIIVWANKSEKEKDCRTLIQVVKLVFEKATDEATFSEMYARLCRKMTEQISPKVQDDSIKNSEGKPFTGGNLFRKYLLSLCQEDFERGWVAEEATTAATSQAIADKAVKETNEKTRGGLESELHSDEYHAAAKSRRRGLGLIRFVGELSKLEMPTERIIHQYIRRLLGSVENPEEEEIENLCMLLTTVGSQLDTPKAQAHLDVYFSRMRELTKNKNTNARMVFLLQVCIYIPCAYDIH
jgi:hypothetical protein